MQVSLSNSDLIVGFVEAVGVRWSSTGGSLESAVNAVVDRVKGGSFPSGDVRKAIRDLLRTGGFKPTGRSKPASEYLSQVALESFPRISNLVDINNVVSLETGWPCSIVDLDLVGDGGLEVRLGRRGESYVFNGAGQFIDLGGLICLAKVDGEAIANPVKDSMATKARESTSRVLFVTYTSRKIADSRSVQVVLERVGMLLREHAGAQSVNYLLCGADAV
ncbi:MAG: phenylalanine--tRNA ligase beta subunit-related protein [Polyangiaceae bacterium]|nr:phenylalanine--tRNA ligase beta subunit-related protein [Polyangiaceae bacterium]